MKQNSDSNQAVYNHQGVGHDKNHIVLHYAVNQKPDGSGNLTQEKPFRDAFARAFFILLVNLFANREQQDKRTGKTYNLFHCEAKKFCAATL